MILKPRLFRKPNPGHPLADFVGCWLMNEGSGNIIQDLSGNGHKGTLADGTSWLSGRYGSTLYFAGSNDNVRIPRSTTLEPSQLTIIVAIKPTSFVSGEQELILGKTYENDSTSPYVSYGLQIGHTTTQFNLFLGFTDDNYVWHESNAGAISNNEQMILAATYDGANVRLYKNGVLDNTVAQTKTIKYDTTSTGDLWFGVDGVSKNIDYTGNLDFVAIYNRALSASEIAQLYLKPFCMFERDPIELWAAAMGGVPPGLSIPVAMANYRRRRIA